MSVDGYIAGPNDDLSFLNKVEKAGEDYGYGDFMAGVDTIIMGRKTYDWVMKQVPVFPHAGIKTYIISRTHKPLEGNIEFYSGNLGGLVASLKEKAGQNIFVDGGSEIVNAMLQDGLLDEMIISIIPAMVGGGTPLFKPAQILSTPTLLSCKKFNSGLVQLHYSLK